MHCLPSVMYCHIRGCAFHSWGTQASIHCVLGYVRHGHMCTVVAGHASNSCCTTEVVLQELRSLHPRPYLPCHNYCTTMMCNSGDCMIGSGIKVASSGPCLVMCKLKLCTKVSSGPGSLQIIHNLAKASQPPGQLLPRIRAHVIEQACVIE